MTQARPEARWRDGQATAEQHGKTGGPKARGALLNTAQRFHPQKGSKMRVKHKLGRRHHDKNQRPGAALAKSQGSRGRRKRKQAPQTMPENRPAPQAKAGAARD